MSNNSGGHLTDRLKPFLELPGQIEVGVELQAKVQRFDDNCRKAWEAWTRGDYKPDIPNVLTPEEGNDYLNAVYPTLRSAVFAELEGGEPVLWPYGVQGKNQGGFTALEFADPLLLGFAIRPGIYWPLTLAANDCIARHELEKIARNPIGAIPEEYLYQWFRGRYFFPCCAFYLSSPANKHQDVLLLGSERPYSTNRFYLLAQFAVTDSN